MQDRPIGNDMTIPAMPLKPLDRQPLSAMASRQLARARSEWQQGRFDAAERSLSNVLALAPDEPDALRMLGMVAQRCGDHAKAVTCYERVLWAWPDDSALRIGLGISLYEIGNAEHAIAQLRRACELSPTHASAHFNLGEALAREAHTSEAVACLCRALEIDPSHLSARLSLAKAYASLGHTDTAVMEFREVLRRDPGNAESWHGLSLNQWRFDAVDIAHLRREFSRDGLSNHNRDLLGFVLAKALESQGEYTPAFELFQRINTSRRARIAWNASAERKNVESIQSAFSGELRLPLDVQLGSEAIFIVSMPRSGSTLVEHILASHPQVEGANEIKVMRQLIEEETQHRGSVFPAWAQEATAQDWHRLGCEYLDRTARWRKLRPRFTDKNLINWRYVGAALTMLPAARIVVVRRDPVETSLACYRQCFTAELGFACDLDDAADYCLDFIRLTRFWRDRYPAQVFDLEYENLQSAPNSVIRRLLDFCGLPFDPLCLEFHKTQRAVLSSPSAAQVRQPLRNDTARSANYGAQLERLRLRLRAAEIAGE